MNRPAEVLTELKRRLAEGELRPGSRLPPERELASELRVGRATLRRALAQLEAEGSIWRGVGRGTFVTDRSAEQGARLDDVDELTSPAEVMEVRLAVEPPLARLAAHRASGKELEEMERLCDNAGFAASQQSYELWDGRLHRAIALAAHNRLFLALFESLNAVRDHTSWGSIRAARRSGDWQAHMRKQHLEIVHALKERDPDGAERAMVDHLRAVRERLLHGPLPSKGEEGRQ